MITKIVSAVTALTLAAGVVCPAFLDGQTKTSPVLTAAAADEMPTSGFCGAEGNEESVKWTFDQTTGTLTISGTGDMEVGSEYGFGSRWLKEIKTVIIESGVTSVGDSAFFECSELTSVVIPDSVTAIGPHAFDSCYALTSVVIPDSVTAIGPSAFEYCYALTAVTIPDSVIAIGYGAFGNCEALTSVTIPDGVTSIGNGAFSGCESLTSVTIPDSVTEIGKGA